MKIEFDPKKSKSNRPAHGLSFEDFSGFDEEATAISDDRLDYGENRYRAFGRINGLGHMIAFTLRDGNIRLISFRRVHEKELRRHEH
jgi:uncharacterized protein